MKTAPVSSLKQPTLPDNRAVKKVSWWFAAWTRDAQHSLPLDLEESTVAADESSVCLDVEKRVPPTFKCTMGDEAKADASDVVVDALVDASR